MYLIVCSTAMEMRPLGALGDYNGVFEFLITGVGPVETAVNLTEYLCRHDSGKLSGVIDVGVAGAYPDTGIDLLDICVAENEFFGDLGICLDDRIDDLDPSFAPPKQFTLSPELIEIACNHLENFGFEPRRGNFVTVSSASGTTERGRYLRGKYQAVCENMEGAAVARVCSRFSLPCLEVRCVSNMVVDRVDQQWRAAEAINSCGKAVEVLMEGLRDG